MRRIFAGVAGSLIFALGVTAQNSAKRLEYEVASIRPALPDHRNGIGAFGGPGTPDPTHIRYNYFLLRLLLTEAYDLPWHQIVLPARLASDNRYDVAANLTPGTKKEQARVMLQNFLIDRFHLKLHREARVIPHYELTIARNGPRLSPHRVGPGAPEMGVRVEGDRNRMRGRKVQMKELIQVLSDDLATPVLDRTGLTGEYDIDLEYSREGLDGFRRPLTATPDVSSARTLQVALEEELGLKLESKKGPVAMLIVDAGDKIPAEN